jgi:transcriptional regulator with XRE-family HTH domain
MASDEEIETRAKRVVAYNVRRLRHDAGLTQEELADRAGIHRTMVGFVERAERNVSVKTLFKLAEGLGCEVGELVHRPA